MILSSRPDPHAPASIDSPANSTAPQESVLRSVRWQLLLAVNGTIGVLLLALLVLDYRREMFDVIRDRQAGLEDNATAVHGAVLHLYHSHGLAEVQQYISAIASTMSGSHSVEHEIVVQVGDASVTSKPAQASELLRLLQGKTRDSDQRLIVGAHRGSNLAVFVGEPFSPVRRSVRAEFVREILGLMVLGVISAAVISYVVMRQVARPLKHLAGLVERFHRGDYSVRADAFSSSELERLATAFNAMGETLAATEESRRKQIEKARSIQRHLLPDRIEIPGIELALRYRPADGVTGDYCDAVEVGEGRWMVCLADVTGHGIPAALGAAMLKMIFRNSVLRAKDLSTALDEMNRQFSECCLPGDFASLLLLRWDSRSKCLEYANAGHEPGLLLAATGVTRLAATGVFLGIDPDQTWTTDRVDVRAGDRLLLSTDGATEMRSPHNQLFGRERLEASLSATRGLNLAASIHHIEQDLEQHRQAHTLSDDLTLVILEFTDG
ncbi:MAG: SpoIIE family protein phosphatase [Planctomycetaceae bacterium]|nr:SpoIIE family protein phosphatase [Planctomycetaceae bacterium]